MKLLFLTNLPSPYMVNFFNELGKLCELTVVFERGFSSERNGRWDDYKFKNFDGVILKGISTSPDSALSVGVCKYLTRGYDYIIVSNPMTPTGIVAIEYMRIKGISYIIESEGSFPKDGKGLKEKFKKHIISNAKAYFSTTERADEYFLAYGAEKEKIYHYPFTSLYDRDVLKNVLSVREKRKLREERKLKGKKIAVAVGRLIPLKRYCDLIKAWNDMPEDWQLYILGEGEEEANLKRLVQEYQLKNIEFCGYNEKEELHFFYKVADLFIHPTSTDVWGLVINEAMACGLPVITTDMCIAGDALIENEVNGYIVSVGDVQELSFRIKKILGDSSLWDIMSRNSLEKIKPYTYENMAHTHIDILKEML